MRAGPHSPSSCSPDRLQEHGSVRIKQRERRRRRRSCEEYQLLVPITTVTGPERSTVIVSVHARIPPWLLLSEQARISFFLTFVVCFLVPDGGQGGAYSRSIRSSLEF